MSDDKARKDLGLTHIALCVNEIERSLAFYRRYAEMDVVHRRAGSDGHTVIWLTDHTRPFVIVLIETFDEIGDRLGGASHIGVGVESRDEVDRRVAMARADDVIVLGPYDTGYPVGYWAILDDPDGHHLELAYGQEVGYTVETQAGF